MLLSIRSRLWLSYGMVILIALAAVTSAITVFLIRNPYTYRQAAVRITAAEGLMDQAPTTAASQITAAEALGVRVLVVSPDGRVRSDTAFDQGTLRNLLAQRKAGRLAATRDIRGRLWLFSRQRLTNGDWRIVATRAPGLLPILDVVRDELWQPLIRAGMVALLLALGLAYLIARWIADPMQALIAAVRSTAGGAGGPASAGLPPAGEIVATITPERGPREVRELTRAFNAMLQRVADSQRSQRELVANVSHELKTPLTAIQGFSEALLDGTAATEDSRRQAAETIQREAARMFRLAMDLLDLARLDAGGSLMRIEPVDLAELLARLKDRFEPIAEASGVRLDTTAANTLTRIDGDRERLLQALGNIIDNAIKFSPRGSLVRVRTEVGPEEVQLIVRDSGPGIPESDHERIFDRFYQADSSRGRGKDGGAGLGLAIAREVVEVHGGRIHVRSTLGQGAEFVVHLPRKGGSRGRRGAA